MRPSLLLILLRFLKLGMTAFGGPAMIPYIRAMAVDREKWVDEKAFRLGMSMTQMIPGATAMQVAAYVGLRTRGGPGALMAYIGFGLPAFLLMLGLSALYFSAQELPAVMAAFKGLQLIIVALIFHASINFAKRYLDSLSAQLLACGAGIWVGLKGNPILALAAVCILALFVFKDEAGGGPSESGPVNYGPIRFAVLLLGALAVFTGVLYVLDPDLFRLCLLMIKIDCFAFGGGYVSVPLMLHEVVEVRGWLTGSQFMDGIALGQVTPGPIVMTGAFVGYAIAGVIGATVATIAVFSPSLIFLCMATPFADRLINSPLVRRALKGSLVSLVGLMAAVAIRFALSVEWGIAEAIIAIAAFLALRMKVDILWVVLAGAAISAVIL